MKQTKLISLSTCILAVAPLQTGHGAHPDFDNDGSADLVTWRTIDGFFYIRSSSGNCPKIATPFFSGCASQWGNPWLGDKPALGDFAGDGHTGMAVYRESDLSWHVRVSWGGQFLGIYMGVSNGTPVVGDYSGDGRSDLALYDSANASWHIRDSTTLRIRVHGNPISRPPTVKKVIPLPADYDADGRFDVGIVSVTLGNDFQWNYRSSRSNRVETMAIRGTANCIPVRGDLNGDRKSDPILWNADTGIWSYFFGGSQGLVQQRQWGLRGDIPRTLDADGDGTDDIAVFRPANGTWYIITSSGAAPRGGVRHGPGWAVQWGLPVDVPFPR